MNRFFNDGKLLLIEYIDVNAEGVAVKVYEQYLSREEAQHFAKRIMWEANTKLKANTDKAKLAESSPTAPEGN